MRTEDLRDDVRRFADAAHSPLSEDEAWANLAPLGVEVAPFLAAAFDSTPDPAGRAALVHRSIQFARISDAAYQLGLRALADDNHKVRHEGCALLAYSLNRAAMSALKPLLTHKDGDTRDDAYAALVAIDAQNHHYFRDRDKSGHIHWIVTPEDEPARTDDAPTTPIQKLKRWLFPD